MSARREASSAERKRVSTAERPLLRSSSRDKDRPKDRERNKDRELSTKEKERERERERELALRRRKSEKDRQSTAALSKNVDIPPGQRKPDEVAFQNADDHPSPESKFPYEISSGRLLTHYDETAGVAIPSSSIEQHRSMGHAIFPLVQSYRERYDQLRVMLTSKLLPRRELLLQLRRQLTHVSTEVAAARKNIERETMADAEQIIERLRTVESMRQSNISLQILQLEEELEAIERVTKRVEYARDDSSSHMAITQESSSNTVITLTSAIPGASAIETIRAPKAALMVDLIQQFSDISMQIDKLSSKNLSVQVDFPTNDFPKEVAERLEVINRCDRYMHALNVKDHMLWTALQDKLAIEEKLEEEKRLTHEYADEVAHWANIAGTLSEEVAQQKKQVEIFDRRNRDLMDILRKHNLHYALPDYHRDQI